MIGTHMVRASMVRASMVRASMVRASMTEGKHDWRQDDWGRHMHDQGRIYIIKGSHDGGKQYYGQNNAIVY